MSERLDNIVKHPATLPVTIGVFAFGIGGVVGYLVGKKKQKEIDTYQPEIHEIPGQIKFPLDDIDGYITSIHRGRSPEELEGVHPAGSDLHFAPPVPPQQTVEDNIRLQREAEERRIYEIVTEEDETPEPERRSIFPDGEDHWDYDIEVPKRSSSAPYILHRDEFYGEEMNYTQLTVTYYKGDDVMVDQDDTPIYNYPLVVGELKFGHGSGDPNVFYVRNEDRHTEYEVLQDPGMYSVDVLGIEIEEEVEKELRHSSHPVRRFRQDD